MERKLLLNLAVTLDGYIAGPNGEYDWCLSDDDYGLTPFAESVDATIMGRSTYEVLAREGDPLKNLTHHVISQKLSGDVPSNVVVVRDDIISYVNQLKRRAGKHIWLFGGAQLINLLQQHNLIDEYVLSVHPLLLGNGIPLFHQQMNRAPLKLISSTAYPSGLVQLRYEPLK